MSTVDPTDKWPKLVYSEWAATKKTLQLYTQMAGKVRLALQPPKPEWLGSCLYPTARGLTSGAMPWGVIAAELNFDFYDHTLSIELSDGRARRISLLPARCVADLYTELMANINELGINIDIWTKPQEVSDLTPLDENHHDCIYEPEHAQLWHRIVTIVGNIFNAWSSGFFGRTSVQFWWGSFDLSVLLFNGKHAEPPLDRGYIMRYDLDAEFLTAGFWPGDDDSPDPIFFPYINPQPPGCALVPIKPDSALWVEQMEEWVLPYEDVRTAEDPRRALTNFLDCIYGVAGSQGGWDLESFKFEAPAPVERG